VPRIGKINGIFASVSHLLHREFFTGLCGS
jgi:hypothetical protein